MSPRRAPLSAWIRSILFVVLMTLVTVPYSLVTVAVRPLPPLPRHRHVLITSTVADVDSGCSWSPGFEVPGPHEDR